MIRGSYFDAQRARAVEATLIATADGRWQLAAGGQVLLLAPGEVTVSDRIGSIPRRLQLPGGAEFETPDNDGIDALLESDPDRSGTAVHALERRWGIALAALVAVALISVALLKFGLPALSGWAAHRVPPAADRAIGAQVLQILDRTMLDPSALPPRERGRLREIFARMTADIDDGHDYRLELRASRIGANALALPSGIVVITDDMVKLARHDEELMAVLAHELGHVRGRHSLRLLIQNAGVSALMLALLGDIGSVSAAVTSAAPLLLHAQYSREVEREADAFARAWLEGQRIDPARFDAILCRMAESFGGEEPPAFLSSHPPTGERVRCATAPDSQSPQEAGTN
jgi:predicted Zn-dependent protease